MKLPDIDKKEKPKITGDPVVVDQSTPTEKKPNFFQKLIFGNTLNDNENKAEKPKKEKKEKIKYTAPKESDLVEWNYEGDADITLGEEHISNTAKIILISLCVVIVCCIGVLIYMRHSIIDFISNPDIQLTNSEINLEVLSDFDPNKYIANYDRLDKLQEYNIDNPVDNQHLGDYVVTYYSKNRVNENVTTLTVHVVDTEAPKIILLNAIDNDENQNTSSINLLEGSEELMNIDPANYVLAITDNYDSSENITLDHVPLTEAAINSAISNSGEENTATLTVDYVATDRSGNSSTATLIINITKLNGVSEDEYQELLAEQAELEAQIEEQRRQLEEQQNQQQQPNDNGNNNQGGGNTEPPQTQPTTPQTTRAPYLRASDVTVYIGGDPQAMLGSLTANVSSYGDIGSISPNTDDTIAIQSAMNQGATGDYSMHWTSAGGSDGSLSCTQIVHVVE